MNRLLVLGVMLLTCTNITRAAVSQEKANDFAALDAEIEAQLSTEPWNMAAETLIQSQWADYKKAHEKPGKRGDFFGAPCRGSIVCGSMIDDLKQFAGAYRFRRLSENEELPESHLKITVSPNNRVFVIEDGRRFPAFVNNNNIVFYTDGTLKKQVAPLGNSVYGQLQINMIYKAEHFNWVTGPADSYVDDMLKLEKVEE